MNIQELVEALKDGRMFRLDWEGPPKNVGEQVCRHLYIQRLNEQLAPHGVSLEPCPMALNGETTEAAGGTASKERHG